LPASPVRHNSRDIRNIDREGELHRESVVAFFGTVQDEGGREVTRQVEYYNLDAIISVSYRVNSQRGTQFRIWATQARRDHLVKGYTVNARRLEELKQTIRLVSTVADRRALRSEEASRQLRVVRDYYPKTICLISQLFLHRLTIEMVFV
jgi:hypothetical protein